MIYEHFRSRERYRVVWSATDATNDSDRSQYVVYMSMKTGEVYVRRANEFHGDVVVSLGARQTTVKRFAQVTP